jgi:hypothetical protein
MAIDGAENPALTVAARAIRQADIVAKAIAAKTI